MIRTWLLGSSVLLLFGCTTAKHKIYYINSYHVGYGSSDDVMRGIKQELKAKDISLKVFYMDTKRHTSPQRVQDVTQQVLCEIKAYQPDCILASDDNAVKYIVVPYLKKGPTPVVFCGVNNTCTQYGLPTLHVTGMLEVLPVAQSIKILKQHNPTMHRLIVLTENSTSARANRAQLTPVYEKLGLTVRYVLVDTFDEWQRAFIQANQNTDLICLPTNGAIQGWDKERACAFVEQHIRVPILTHDDFMMPYAVFGLTKVAQEQGQWAARTALAIMNGQSPAEITVTQNQQTRMYVNQTLAHRINFHLPIDLHSQCIVVK